MTATDSVAAPRSKAPPEMFGAITRIVLLSGMMAAVP